MNDMLTNGSMPSEQGHLRIDQVYQLGLLLVIAYATWTASPTPLDPASKTQALSVIGNVFGADFALRAIQFLPVLKLSLLAMLFLWITRQAQRWTFVLAPLTFILLMSCVIETQYFARHQTNFAAMAFVVLGATRFYAADPNQLQQGVLNKPKSPSINPMASDALPQWAFLLLIFYIGISYTMSGLTKLHFSGWQWSDGRALMIWVDTLSLNPNNFLTRLISGNVYIAAIMQTTTFVVELCAILMLPFPKLRPIFGIALVGFHLSVEYMMGYGFYANIFLDFYLLIVCFGVSKYRVGLADVFAVRALRDQPWFSVSPTLKTENQV